MSFKLPELPYAMDALQPHISKETLEYHYGKHHNAYVTKANGMLDGSKWANADDSTLPEIIKEVEEGGMFNNVAQIYNHTFYWHCLSPSGGGTPTGKVAEAINASFGSFDEFKTQFSDAAATLFGSGWAWLAKKGDKLEIQRLPNAGCPIRTGDTPVLTCDVWEHAYYVDYRNARPKYIDAFWNLVNWEFVEKNLG